MTQSKSRVKNTDMVDSKQSILEVKDLWVSFGKVPIVKGVSFKVETGDALAILGPNGAGKTTILKSIVGVVPHDQGSILLWGESVGDMPSYVRVRKGIVYVPEGMQVFPHMTVRENMELGAYYNRANLNDRVDMVLRIFPELKRYMGKMAWRLSGGQQRMVTIARALMTGGHLLLLDDPFLGLSPRAIDFLSEALVKIHSQGLTLVVCGQHIRNILAIVDKALLVVEGKRVLSGESDMFLDEPIVQKVLFGAVFCSPDSERL